jgi:hypothetical protein
VEVPLTEWPDPRMRSALEALTPEQRSSQLRVLTSPEPVRGDVIRRFFEAGDAW